jgi:hypothetical protein
MTVLPILCSNVSFGGNKQHANIDMIAAGRHMKRGPMVAAKK